MDIRLHPRRSMNTIANIVKNNISGKLESLEANTISNRSSELSLLSPTRLRKKVVCSNTKSLEELLE